jgi:hypothetical protein
MVREQGVHEAADTKGAIHGIRATASPAKVLSGLAVSAAAIDPMSQLFAASASLSYLEFESATVFLLMPMPES